MNQNDVAVVEVEQSMIQDYSVVEQPAIPRKAEVVNRMDPIVPYVSFSSDEDEGKSLFSNTSLL